jgi:glutamate-1-semialdehyde 2,1-aminomutase
MPSSRSALLLDEARKFIPGGVNSANRLVEPFQFFARSKGSRIWDADGNEFIDYHAGFGPPILGHNNPKVNKFVKETMDEIDFIGVGGMEMETRVAEKIVLHVPSAEKVLLCTSGSEATYHALRLARAHTRRKKIIKFQGCYHGWHDAILTNVLSAPDKLGKLDPHSKGILPEVLSNTIVVDFNDLEGVRRAVRANRGCRRDNTRADPAQHRIHPSQARIHQGIEGARGQG